MPADLFAAGENLLAIQGINRSRDSSDFFLDVALFGEPVVDPAADQRRLETFRRAAGAEAFLRRRYMEGRILQRQGEHAEASDAFREVVAGLDHGAAPEPYLRLAESLVLAGKPREAEAELWEALGREPSLSVAVWRRWFEAAAVDPGLDASAVISRWPAPFDEGTPAWASDLHWALDLLSRGESLRIRAGSGDPIDAAWSRDRFSHGGEPSGGIVPGPDGPVERTQRTFPRSWHGGPGYRIPLPRGRYEVTLHFDDVGGPEGRRFDVVIEGATAIRNLATARASGSPPLVRRVETEVADGSLDIRFQARLEPAMVTAIEVRRL